MTKIVEIPTGMSPEWRDVANALRETFVEQGVDPLMAEYIAKRLHDINERLPPFSFACDTASRPAVDAASAGFQRQINALSMEIVTLLGELWAAGARR